MIADNNPYNIRYSKKNNWIGQTGMKRGFCCFDTMEHGIRACFRLLNNYILRGCDTPQKIISRFAPSCENNTNSYIKFVCDYTWSIPTNNRAPKFVRDQFDTLRPDQKIVIFNDLFELMSRMAWYESNTFLTPVNIALFLGVKAPNVFFGLPIKDNLNVCDL